MRRTAIAMLLLLAACSGMVREAPTPIKGRLILDTDPNPLVVRQVGEDLYELAFAIVMREEGGVDVRIEDFTVEALAFKSVVVQSQTFPATSITGRGYPDGVAAGQYLRFDFVKRWPLPTRLLLSGAVLRVTARTVDAAGRRDESKVRIPVVVETNM